MRFERYNVNMTQAVLLTLGALVVFLPLLAMSEQKPISLGEKALGEQGSNAPVQPVVTSKEDFTKAGVSRVEAIFILRQERGNED